MKKCRPCRYTSEQPLVNSTIGEQLLRIRIGETNKVSLPHPESISTPVNSNEDVEDNATNVEALSLKHAKLANGGKALYLTFGGSARTLRRQRRSTTLDRRLPSPSRILLSRSTKTAARWASVFGYEALDLNPLGLWLREAWETAEEAHVVELACEYALSSMHVLESRTSVALSRAYVTGSKALQALQVAVRICSGQDGIRRLLLASLLHSAAEHFIQLGTFNYVPHFLGATKLLNMYEKNIPSDDIIWTAVRSACIDEMMEAILDGKESSMFEDICRLPAYDDSAKCDEIDLSMQAIRYMLAQLPRLVFEAREAMQNDAGNVSTKVVADRVGDLVYSDLNLRVEQTLKANSKALNCHHDAEAAPLGSYMEFSSIPAFYLAVGYFFSQMISCSLLQRLHEARTDKGMLSNLSTARERETSAASSLAMCVEYALRPGPLKPFTALAILGPIQLSLGSWIRLRNRQQSTETPEYNQATTMIDWCLTRAHYIEEMWRSAPASVERMTSVCEMFAGGPHIAQRGL